MPRELEKRIARAGRKRGLKGERLKRYVFGTMNKLGLLHSRRTKRI